MQKLHARLNKTWDSEPFIARVTTNAALPLSLRHTEALISNGDNSDCSGYRTILCRSTEHDSHNDTIQLPADLEYVADGDIIHVIPRSGEIFVIYRKSSRSNSMLITDQCNSNCLMCSQPPKPYDDSYLVDMWREAIPLMWRGTPEIGITGGEPTLRGGRLLQVIRDCKNYLPETSLHMLSNGRLFKYLRYCEELASIAHPDFMVGIPLYSDLPHLHDFVVQAEGAFDQTIRGILNLKRCGVRVEIRVVLHRQTIDRLPNLARFITRNLLSVDHIALMGLEMMGYVKMNMDALWVDPFDYQSQLMEAVEELDRRHMNVSIYNHQLCVLPKCLWQFSCKSISDWKNEYLDVCNGCQAKSECGGFFSSAKIRHSSHIAPLVTELAN